MANRKKGEGGNSKTYAAVPAIESGNSPYALAPAKQQQQNVYGSYNSDELERKTEEPYVSIPVMGMRKEEDVNYDNVELMKGVGESESVYQDHPFKR